MERNLGQRAPLVKRGNAPKPSDLAPKKMSTRRCLRGYEGHSRAVNYWTFRAQKSTLSSGTTTWRAAFATNSISPPKSAVLSQSLTARKKLWRHREDSQLLPLAIGKKGQNVQLASKLIGWRVESKKAR